MLQPAPAPDWQMNAHGAAHKAVQAYLSGETRVAALEFARARQETARTGQPALLAQVHLLECAAQVASLEMAPCSAFDALRPDASAAQTAYADYLAGVLAPQAAALLPPSQQAVVLATEGNAATALAAIADPGRAWWQQGCCCAPAGRVPNHGTGHRHRIRPGMAPPLAGLAAVAGPTGRTGGRHPDRGKTAPPHRRGGAGR